MLQAMEPGTADATQSRLLRANRMIVTSRARKAARFLDLHQLTCLGSAGALAAMVGCSSGSEHSVDTVCIAAAQPWLPR